MTPKSDTEIVKELKEAVEGLLVTSESDYPLEPFKWSGENLLTATYLCHVSGKPENSPVEEIDIGTFFQFSGRFDDVASLVKSNLTDVRVFKVGRINIRVYIVGRSPEGNWLGLSTQLVQT